MLWRGQLPGCASLQRGSEGKELRKSTSQQPVRLSPITHKELNSDNNYVMDLEVDASPVKPSDEIAA